MTNQQMVADLMKRGVLKNESIRNAFLQVDRINFVLEQQKEATYDDNPLPISEEATISQPYTVALMLEWLDPKSGEKILEVGSGSGWVVALLGKIVGKKGFVYGLELDPQLVKFGKNNIKNLYKKINKSEFGIIEILQSTEVFGLPDKALFDRILVSASAREIPKELVDQLKIGGKMVIPVGHAIYVIEKISKDNIKWEKFDGFSFVPLIG